MEQQRDLQSFTRFAGETPALSNRCVPDAWLRGASRALPAEPSAFDWPERAPPAGCNHMVCLDCKAEVKSQVGYNLALDWEQRERVPQRALQLHASDDWSQVDGIEVEPDFRLYTCRCFYHSLWQLALTFNPERIDMTQEPTRNLPWTCAGHPPLELPVELAGRTIRDAAALPAAIVDAAQNPAQASAVLDLYFRTHHGSLEGVVPDALAGAAAGPAPLPAALEALFESQTRLAPLSAFVEELVRVQRGLARADPERRAQLIDVLTSAVWQRPSGVVETGTLALLRDEALGGVTTLAQLRMFEMQDREWLVAHVEALLAKNPDRAGAILARAGRAMLYGAADPEATLRTLAALARKTGVAAETLSAQAEAALGVLVVDSKPVLDAIKGTTPYPPGPDVQERGARGARTRRNQ